MKIFEIIVHGGFIMYPLLICSILVWAVFIEKYFFLVKFNRQIKSLFQNAQNLMDEGKINECVGLAKSADPHLRDPLLAVLQGKGNSKETWEKNIIRKLSETQLILKRFLWILGTIGNLAPFIGLFGTVIGIIKSFDSMSSSGASGFSVVSSGLAEALIATAAGILVAIVSVVFYNFFQTKINALYLRLKNNLEELSEKVERI
jgi:biopolymer transport protein ExbB